MSLLYKILLIVPLIGRYARGRGFSFIKGRFQSGEGSVLLEWSGYTGRNADNLFSPTTRLAWLVRNTLQCLIEIL